MAVFFSYATLHWVKERERERVRQREREREREGGTRFSFRYQQLITMVY